ncbi:3-deoxy-D-manno-octulosonic acid kinase [Kerstersia gyiorum]|nr:3-deoxy-D-manno-octulosonic acid kinase [Kerstersia gyiorum]MCR4158582.1 3-deoxy-D-manno-octulosonic acid kinase [Kerstersia gyiorum]
MKAELQSAPARSPTGEAIVRWRGGAMIYDPQALSGKGAQAGPHWLTPPPGAQPVGAGGRQAAWYVEGDFGAGVLRGYRRGGLLARINRDRYLWQGEDFTRPFREFRLMAGMRAAGLPVPQVLAAGYWRTGPWYRAALLTRRIPGAVPLAKRLADRCALTLAARAVFDMHQAGVYHADLNVYNLLFDATGAPWIIDMDRGRLGLDEAQRRETLARLRRSFLKVGGEVEGGQAWQIFSGAYMHCTTG